MYYMRGGGGCKSIPSSFVLLPYNEITIFSVEFHPFSLFVEWIVRVGLG
jgi:hypothetical protein